MSQLTRETTTRHHESKRSSACLLGIAAFLVFGAGLAQAQLPGQAFGVITDENEKPVEGVLLTVTDPDRPDFKQETTTDKRGRYKIHLANATVTYNLQIQKEGYQTVNRSGFKVPARRETRVNFTILSAAAAMAAAEESGDVDAEAAAKGSAINVFNLGVQALNAGQVEEAIAHFKEAIEKKEDLGNAWAALARAYYEKKSYQDAVETAEKAITLEADIDSMNQILYTSYSALGDDKKAEAALAKLKESDPERAGKNMFNEAADLYNNGQMAEARAAFEKILEVSPDEAKAHYMLGLVLVGMEENSAAKEHLSRFIELAPDDPDAATAREMIQYLQ